MISLSRAGVAVLVLFGAAGPAPPIPQAATSPSRADRATPPRPAPPDVDLLAIRNIFRYADEPGLGSHSGTTDAIFDPTPGVTTPSPPARVRLVGIVHRGGTPVAALAIDGEVVLLAEGETGSGFTVLGIRGEAVHLRDPEGDQTTLELP